MKRKILSALLIVIIISLPISVFAYVNSDTGLKFNKSGKSYGTVYDAITVPDEPLSVNEPDLIYVLATNGKYGYAKKEESSNYYINSRVAIDSRKSVDR